MKQKIILRSVILAALGVSTAVLAQDVPIPPSISDGETTGDQVNLTTDRSTRMTVPVNVAGRGPYNFVVDTGAERTVISRELAGELGLVASGQVNMHSISEAAMVNTVMIPTLSVSNGSVTDIRAPALSRSNIGAAGILGVDSLKSQRVVLDFRKQTMTIIPSAVREEKWDLNDTIVVTARSKYGQLVLVDASANGEKVQVILDTGAQVSIGNMALRKKMLGGRRADPANQIELISVTGGTIQAEYTIVKKVRIGGVEMTNLPVAFVDAHPFRKLGLIRKPALLLGMDALKNFERVSVDFANKKVRFMTPDGAGLGQRESLAALRPSPIKGLNQPILRPK